MRVLSADAAKQLRGFGAREMGRRVSAEQRERDARREVVPQALQTKGRPEVPFLGQNVHHLAVDPQTPMGSRRERCHQIADHGSEQMGD